jgi:hypothetical protein
VFADVAAAFLFALDYDENFARSGDLLLTVVGPPDPEDEDPEPAPVISIRKLNHAVLDPPRRRVIGCTVLLDYVAIGGELEVYTPPEPEP